MSKIKAIDNPDCTCYKCLKKFNDEQLNIIHIPSMGWGSRFDNWSTEIHLCNECIKETNPEWWKLEEVVGENDWRGSWYKYEDDIFSFVNSLPLEGQELFWNRYAKGCNSHYMLPQDWIDYELDILPHEKCKEYSMYSPQERRAYQEKFPICDKVKIVIYDDGSQSSRCPFGAFGNKDGTAEGHQTQTKCYDCVFFENRKGEIEMCDKEDMEIFELEQRLAMAKIKKNIGN